MHGARRRLDVGTIGEVARLALRGGDLAARGPLPSGSYQSASDAPSCISATSSVARFTFQSLAVFHTWLASYGLPSNGSADYLDSDGDGLNNWQEYLAGTIPTNGVSSFKFTSSQMISNTQVVLRWSSTSNRLYDVLRATNLAAGASAFVPVPGATNLAGTPPQNTWTDSITRPSFYRLSVHQ